MNCEEFANAGLDHDLEAGGPEFSEVREHLRACPDCAALYETSRVLRADLRGLGQETSEASAPSRIEMRLRQEFRTQHRTVRTHRVTWLAGWSLATASIIAGAVVWVNWHRENTVEVANRNGPAVQAAPSIYSPHEATTEKPPVSPASPARSQTPRKERTPPFVATKASDEFTPLPGSVPGFLDDSTIVRVQLQRGTLGAFGLPVSEERASDWIQVDLLVAADGQPQALRLPQSASN